MGIGHSTRLLRQTNFRRFLIGRVTSALGTNIALLALVFGLLDLGASAATLGLVLAASTIPQVILTLLGGVIGDRLERRFVMIGTDAVQGLVQLTIGALLLTGHASVWAVFLLRFVYGAAASFLTPAMNGAIVDVVGAESMQEARSFITIGTSTARLMGPAIGGALVAVFNPGWALIIDSVTFAISAFNLSRLTMPRRPVSMTNSLRSDFMHGWQEFTSRSWAVKMIITFMLYQATALPAVFVLGPVHAKASWHGAASWAAVMAGIAIGDFAGGLLMLRWRPRRLLTTANWLWALDVPLILCIGLQLGSPWPAAVAAIGFGMAMTTGSALWFQALATHVPSESLARVTSYDELGSLALNPLGYALIGLVAAGIGFGATFAIVIGTHVAALVWLLASADVRAITREPSTQAS